jgi:N-methylhydantoinase A
MRRVRKDAPPAAPGLEGADRTAERHHPSARVGVDVGGTFTDCVAVAPDGRLTIRKVATTPHDPTAAVWRAAEAVGGPVGTLIHGTTIATNALLQRRGARVVLVATAGFEDLLWLRRQDRAALYDLARHHPPPLVAAGDVLGVAERMGPDGVVAPLKVAEIKRVVARLTRMKPEAVAIALLFAFRHSEHERLLAAAIRTALPDVPVAASHEILPVFREFERTSTTTAEAYLRPAVTRYLERLGGDAKQRGVGALRVMTSAGGTLTPEQAAERAAALALSGPAGGVVGAARAGTAAGFPSLLTLDMGGTSADASLVLEGLGGLEGPGEIAGVPLALPALAIETVSAGGGSLARVDEGGALKVGPESAGAVPGPACYGRGGTLPTVTDACLVLGWLDPDQPLADDLRLDPAAAWRVLEGLSERLGRGPEAAAGAVIDVAVAVMGRALRRVSVARGVDPRGLALLPFGGAGPLFGCALAESLGMTTVVIPPHAGVLSALGLAGAAERVDVLASFHRPLATLDAAALRNAFAPLLAEAGRRLPRSAVQRLVDCRFVGQGYEVTVPIATEDGAGLGPAFVQAHRQRFGHAPPDLAVEVVNLRVRAERQVAAPPPPPARNVAVQPRPRDVLIRGTRQRAAVWPLDDLPAGLVIAGPAVLPGRDATALLEPGWRATVHASGALVARRA